MRVNISPTVLSEIATGRIRASGMVVHGHRPAPLDVLGSEPDFEFPSVHLCHQHQVVHLPPFLCVPIAEVPSVDVRGGVWLGDPHHDAYWVVGAIMTHFHHQRPESDFRDISAREAVCLLAQLPQLGSIRFWDGLMPDEPVAEACRWTPGGMHIHRTRPACFMFPGLNHHRVWIKTSSVTHCSSTRTLKCPRRRSY